MNLFIPTIGTKITLSEPWRFTLHAEGRNSTLGSAARVGWANHQHEAEARRAGFSRPWEYPGPVVRSSWCSWSNVAQPNKHGYGEPAAEIRLEAGTVLTVDRIYIRKGLDDFDSLSFWASPGERMLTAWPIIDGKLTGDVVRTDLGKKPGRLRFWAKLVDVNAIKFEAAGLAVPEGKSILPVLEHEEL